MPVTEIAILPLTHTLTLEAPLPPSLFKKLQTTKTVLERASGYPFLYFQQIEDPTLIYLVGRWNSVAAHNEYLPSKENLRLLELLKDDIVQDGQKGKKLAMWHLDADVFNLNGKECESVFSAPVVAFNRHFVHQNKKSGFTGKFEEVKPILEKYVEPFQLVGGWRIEKEEGVERHEWDLFSGWESVDQHFGFAKTPDFAKYREITGFTEGFEVKHLKKIEGL